MKTKSNFFSKSLNKKERILYDRQFRLTNWDQEFIKKSKVLIVGVGGLGCEIAKNLAMLGVNMYLLDLDTIEHTNLNRQVLFSRASVGQPKARVAAKFIKKHINPNVHVRGIYDSLEKVNPVLYEKVDLVVSGLDSMNARLILNNICIQNGKILVDGGTKNYHGHVYSVFPGKNACLECYPVTVQDDNDMDACTVVGEPRKRNHCALKAMMKFKELTNRDPNVEKMRELQWILKQANAWCKQYNWEFFTLDEIIHLIDVHEPAIITINSVIAAIQSHEVVKILHWLNEPNNERNLGPPLMQYLIYNGMTGSFYALEKKRNPECMVCGPNAKRIQLKMSTHEPIQNIVKKLQKKGLPVSEYSSVANTSLEILDLRQRLADAGIMNNSLLFVDDINVLIKIRG
ncbi:MAG: ThiF family adenylyltransferase [Candidatus Helarchaeota archaeon]